MGPLGAPNVIGSAPLAVTDVRIAAATLASVPLVVSPEIHSATIRAPARAEKSEVF